MSLSFTQYIHIYCMTGRTIWGNIVLRSTRPKGGQYRGREWNISPYCPTRGIAIIDLLYDFRVTIDTGNNEQAIRENIAI